MWRVVEDDVEEDENDILLRNLNRDCSSHYNNLVEDNIKIQTRGRGRGRGGGRGRGRGRGKSTRVSPADETSLFAHNLELILSDDEQEGTNETVEKEKSIDVEEASDSDIEVSEIDKILLSDSSSSSGLSDTVLITT